MLSDREEQMFVDLRRRLEAEGLDEQLIRRRVRDRLKWGATAMLGLVGCLVLLGWSPLASFAGYVIAVFGVHRFSCAFGPDLFTHLHDWAERRVSRTVRRFDR